MTDSLGNRLIEVDGIDLRNEAYNVSTRTGMYSMPDTRGENLTLPGVNGSVYVPNKPFDAGQGVLKVWAIGATPGSTLVLPSTVTARKTALETNIATLMRFFTRHHRLSVIRAAQPDGTIRRADVEWREWSEPEVQADGTRAEWEVSYEIPGVWWRDESPTVQTSAASATLPKDLDLTNFTGMTGILEDAVLTVTGAITDPVITDVETGAWVKYTGTVAAGQSWVVDVGAFTSTVGGSSVLSATTHAGGYRFLTIPNCYGANNYARLRLSGSGASAANSLSISGYRKWVNG